MTWGSVPGPGLIYPGSHAHQPSPHITSFSCSCYRHAFTGSGAGWAARGNTCSRQVIWSCKVQWLLGSPMVWACRVRVSRCVCPTACIAQRQPPTSAMQRKRPSACLPAGVVGSDPAGIPTLAGRAWVRLREGDEGYEN